MTIPGNQSSGAIHCRHCGRRLTDPQSVRRGYGPECAQKLGIIVTVEPKRRGRRRVRPSDRQLVFGFAKEF